MRLAKLALPLFVVFSASAGVAALLLAPAPQEVPIAIEPAKPSEQSPPNTENSRTTEENNARDVGGGALPNMLSPDIALERLAPLPPVKKLEVFGPPRPPLNKEEPLLLFRPLVVNAGTIIAEGRTVTLASVLPVEVERVCFTIDQQPWPCGMKARTAFRSIIRGRAIACFLPDQQKAEVVTECSIGKENLGEWLVEQGWAEAKPGSELESLGKAAKLMGRGIFGSGD